ncbi:MAG: hypothetical protein HY743_11305, partial [Deltaproteobacteria bacterium]|nr:hypothetical protein [Deltaproteobacteria bacterium]
MSHHDEPQTASGGGPALSPELQALVAEQVRLQVAGELKRLGLDPARPKRVA